MNWLRELARRFRMLMHRRQFDTDLEEEMRLHLELRQQQQIECGMTPDDARAAATRGFGNVTSLKEKSQMAWGWEWFEHLVQDMRYGLRMLRKSPGFTTVAVVTLALGIGANTAIFSLINVVALRSLPVPSPQQLVLLQWRAHTGPSSNQSYVYGGCPEGRTWVSGCSFSYPMFQQILAEQNVFSGLFAFATRSADLSINGRANQLQGAFVSGEFFSTLGARASIGRTLDSIDDADGADPVIVLSYGYWQDQLGSDASIVGKTAIVNRKPFRIVGVAQRGFQLDPGIPMDFWLPLFFQPEVDPYLPKRTASNSLWLDLMARLKPGASPERAAVVLTTIFVPPSTSGANPIFKPEDAPQIVLTSATQGLATLRKDFSVPLFVLMTAVGMVLLIACANVAGLMLVRSSARQKEMAVRSALGAGRRRIIRQLLTESVLLAAVGGALGILLAELGAKSLASFLSMNWYSPLQMDVSIDRHVLGFTLVVSIVVGILFGLAPSLRGSRIELTPVLKESGRQSGSAAKRTMLLNNMLVVAQVAISIVVLDGAGLLVRTLVNLRTMNVGFQTRNVLLFSVDMTLSGYRAFNDPRSYKAEQDLRNRFSALPGVKSASYSMVALLSGSNMNSEFNLPGRPKSSALSADELPVGPEFFETMQIPLLTGRAFSAADFESSAKPEPVIINQTFARKLFGQENPLGRGVSEAYSDKPQWQVIGTVRDAKYASLRSEVRPTVYTLDRNSGASFELRTKGDPRLLIPIIHEVVRQADPSFLIADMKTQLEQIDQSLYQERLIAALSGLFGILAVILASIGLYGLVAYGVARRRHEIGVRMALGAQPYEIFRLMARQGLVLTFAGVAIGVGVAAGITRYLQSLLFGVQPTDPWTFGSMAILLTLVALAACYIPARRAMRVDPMIALRYE
jgi:predicted permease